MKYEEAFIAGFAEEMEKQAWVSAALRAIPAAARAIGGYAAKKVPALASRVAKVPKLIKKVPKLIKNAPKKAWNVVKKNPTISTMAATSVIPGGGSKPKVAKPINTAPEYVQKAGSLL